ncbi:MAG: glycoside hydrolase family 15 protein [Myxococcota bacterium]
MALFGATLALVVSVSGAPAAAQTPGRSYERLVTSNGFAAASYNRESRRWDTFLEHPYRFRTPRNMPEDLCYEADESRDLMFDSYFGVRVGSDGTWLSEVPLTDARYDVGTQIIRTEQFVGEARSLRARTYGFMPMAIDQPALVLIAELENVGTEPLEVDGYALFNLRLGNANGGREPSAEGEEASWDDTRQVLYEYGPSQGTFGIVALTPVSRVSTSTGDDSAFNRLVGGRDLIDGRATLGPVNDMAPAFQSERRTLAPGETLWMATALVWALDEDAGPDVDELRSYWNDRSPAEVLAAERSAWEAWHTPVPEGLSEAQAELYLHSAATLRMGQVREPGLGFGQILASLPPGQADPSAQWNISWVRDMAYATAGLARSGHLEEARAALEFQLKAPMGRHELEVGRPYRISITRYFGDGQEESDCNQDGPNIEFDGFGLFLWSLGEYLRAGGDASIVTEYWPVLRDEVIEVLRSLVDSSGVIKADSSIWEVHWNGKQRRFSYTSLAAIRGLCDAAAMATTLGETDAAASYVETANGIRAALLERATDERGALGQSVEDVLSGANYIDAATVEAINWGVVDPEGVYASATLNALLDNLRVATGKGLMRNDDGGWYDSQEWVFVDLRLIPALRRNGRSDEADTLLTWLEEQTLENDLQFAELLEANTGAYAGSVPMVGFGAGAYILALTEADPTGACGSFAPEPSMNDGGTSPDGGTGADGGAVRDGAFPDGGLRPGAGSPPDDSGCAVSFRAPLGATHAWLSGAATLFLLARRRRRR